MRASLSLLLLAAVCAGVLAEDPPAVDLHSPALVSVSLNRPNPILIGSTFSVAVVAADSRPDAPLFVSWDLGDGQTYYHAMTYDAATSTFGDSLTYQYNVGGVYTIKASVSDENNNVATDSVTVVVPTVPSLSSFTVNPNPAAAGSLVTVQLSFEAYDDGTTPVQVVLNFGDGTPAVTTAATASAGSLLHTASFTHTYASSGSYVISTSITDSINQSIQFKRNVGVPNGPEMNSFFVSANGNTLTAALLFNAYAPGASVPVTFSFCDGHTQTITSYFDTGLGQYNAQCSHEINAAGVCTVSASVTDALGQQASVQRDFAY